MSAISGSGQTRAATSLTHRTIESFKAEDRPYRVPDTRCAGLAVRIATGGAKTFDFSYRIKGTGVRRVSLGQFPADISLDDARNRASDLRKAGRSGRDLMAEEKRAAAESARRITVAALIEDYARRHVRGRLKTAKEIEARLNRALASKLDVPAAELKRRDVRELCDQVADSGFDREAEKRRQTIGAMYRWAVARDLVEGDPTAGLQAYDPGQPRDRVLSEVEIRQLWDWLGSGAFPPVHADVLRLQLLTGARCGEAAGITADEINTLDWTWTLPAQRSKNSRARITPLVGMAREIIEERLPTSGPVFPSDAGTPLTASHVGGALITRRERLPIAHFSTHDMRRTFATALDTMGVSLDLIAAIVGHESSSGREAKTLIRHYLRTDKLDRKRTTLDAWDARLRLIITGTAETENVIPLRQAS
jgi:integrase